VEQRNNLAGDQLHLTIVKYNFKKPKTKGDE
jgi:hypothetical protein